MYMFQVPTSSSSLKVWEVPNREVLNRELLNIRMTSWPFRGRLLGGGLKSECKHTSIMIKQEVKDIEEKNAQDLPMCSYAGMIAKKQKPEIPLRFLHYMNKIVPLLICTRSGNRPELIMMLSIADFINAQKEEEEEEEKRKRRRMMERKEDKEDKD